MAKIKKQNIVEITRSFSYKLNMGNYQTADFFCSEKAECQNNKAEKTSEQLYQFVKSEVIKSVNNYIANEKRTIELAELKKNSELWAELKKYFAEHKDELSTYGKESVNEKMARESKLIEMQNEQIKIMDTKPFKIGELPELK